MIFSFRNELDETLNIIINDPPSRRAGLKLAHDQLRTIPGEHVWILNNTEGDTE
jgi:hypothetical protein